jgi:phosphoglycolate phosphatase-like HAD superfamily hydrolase
MANIIFDFDGTIADSFEVIVSIIKKLTHVRSNLDEESMYDLRQLPISAIMKKLKVRSWQLPLLLLRGRYMMKQRIKEIKLFDGMVKTLEELHAEGHNLFIVSSNSSRNVIELLKQHHLEESFVDIEGGVSLFNKDRALTKLVKRNSLDSRETWYIGDELRDIDAATTTQLRSIAVTWGFTDKNTLISHQPTAVAEKPTDIMTILNDSSIIR